MLAPRDITKLLIEFLLKQSLRENKKAIAMADNQDPKTLRERLKEFEAWLTERATTFQEVHNIDGFILQKFRAVLAEDERTKEGTE